MSDTKKTENKFEAKPVDKDGAEAKLTAKHASGVDQTGRQAPNQFDQVHINKEKREAAESGKPVGDPRWLGSANMAVVPSTDEGAKEVNEQYAKDAEEAAKKDSAANPKMGVAKEDKK